MNKPILISTSIGLCWIFSPENLVLVGNIAGSGYQFIGFFGLSLLLFYYLIANLHSPSPGHSSSTPFSQLSGEIGTLPAMTIVFSARSCMLLVVATGMLVTAGFTFNETFLYWFPNFGFSYIVLGFITCIHVVDEKYAQWLQPVCIGICLAGLLTLSLLGLFGLSGSGAIVSTPPEATSEIGIELNLSALPLAFLVFLGFDNPTHHRRSNKNPILASLIIAFLVLTLWGMVSLQFVERTRLAQSTIPHILAAKEILGQPGRILMGFIIISGACGAVNGFFLLAKSSFSEIAQAILSMKREKPTHSPSPVTPTTGQRALPISFALIIGALMGGGLAGSDYLDTYIYGSLILWFLLLCALSFAAIKNEYTTKNIQAPIYYFLTVTMLSGIVMLLASSAQPQILIAFLLLVLMSCAGISALLLWCVTFKDREVNPKQKENL